MAEPHKIAIILENTGNEPNGIAVFRELKSIATSDYFAAGRDLSRKELEQPLTDKPLYSFVMPPKSRQLVFTDLEHSPIPKRCFIYRHRRFANKCSCICTGYDDSYESELYWVLVLGE